MQNIIWDYHNIEDLLKTEKVNRVMLVCGNSMSQLSIATYINELSTQYDFMEFKEFTPNPRIESVYLGAERFRQEKCDFMMAVGGGSSIDVAKCIKKEINDSTEKKVKMLAIPTTAGTGSESTQFAVVYEKGEKKSVDALEILPEYVILDGSLLEQLPAYQKKATMLDALCQAIESIWARKATEQSRELAAQAISMIIKYWKPYIGLPNSGQTTETAEEIYHNMLKAANLSGQAIHITRTTAAHAMSYQLTSLFGVAHGHAVAICLPVVWQYMIEQPVREPELISAYELIAKSFGCSDIRQALDRYRLILKQMDFSTVRAEDNEQIMTLVSSVNEQRLGNHPILLSRNDLQQFYEQICQ